MPPKTGHFILRSNVLPPVTAGSYELEGAQTGTPFTVNTERTNVKVSSPRYTMPTDQILSSFPPANAEGAFGDRLPQIVLKRRTLPWERNPFGKVEVSTTPWLALVVVAEGEAELSLEPRPVAECVTPGTTLLDPADKDVDRGYCLSATETVIRKMFPCQEDLALLTHVREVDVDDTELANGDDDGFLAVVLANRLPVFDAANGRSVRYQACLVNLEGQLARAPAAQSPGAGLHLRARAGLELPRDRDEGSGRLRERRRRIRRLGSRQRPARRRRTAGGRPDHVGRESQGDQRRRARRDRGAEIRDRRRGTGRRTPRRRPPPRSRRRRPTRTRKPSFGTR